MRVLLIVNATASSVTARTRVVIQKALSADHDVEVAHTIRPSHAARLARGAASGGADVVAVLGGDGTVNEAADGLMGTGTALAPLPGGSTNVYARTIGVARAPIDATAQLLGSLERRSFRRIGLGTVDGRVFLFHCGLGFDAAVIDQVDRRVGAFKRYAAHPAFVLAAVTTWLRTYDHRRPRFEIELCDGPDPGGPGGEVLRGGVFAIVSKTSPYTYLGARPLVVAPDAGLDSTLCVAVFRTPSTLTMLRLAASALGRGHRLRRHHSVVHRDGVTTAIVRAADPFPYQVDGEYLGETQHLSLRYVPDCLTLVVP